MSPSKGTSHPCGRGGARVCPGRKPKGVRGFPCEAFELPDHQGGESLAMRRTITPLSAVFLVVAGISLCSLLHGPSPTRRFTLISCRFDTGLDSDGNCLSPGDVGGVHSINVNEKTKAILFQDDKNPDDGIFLQNCDIADVDTWKCTSPDPSGYQEVGMARGKFYEKGDNSITKIANSSVSGPIGWALGHSLVTMNFALLETHAPIWQPAVPGEKEPGRSLSWARPYTLSYLMGGCVAAVLVFTTVSGWVKRSAPKKADLA